MRHQKTGRRLGRTTAHRKSVMTSLATGLFLHERVTTTEAKAKEARSVAEEMISLAKRGDLHARRQATAFLRSKPVVGHLFATIGPRYASRSGGYTRIVRLGPRRGDSAPMVLLELV
jgi:large subunit ribosomal protein L17